MKKRSYSKVKPFRIVPDPPAPPKPFPVKKIALGVILLFLIAVAVIYVNHPDVIDTPLEKAYELTLQPPQGQYLTAARQETLTSALLSGLPSANKDTRVLIDKTGSNPLYVYQLQRARDVNESISVLMTHGIYAFPNATAISVKLILPDETFQTYTATRNVIELFRGEQISTVEFYANLTT